MENRFGVKDFILFALVGLVIVLIVLGMRQFDRQWDDVQTINKKMIEQGRDLAAITRMLSNGAGVAASGNKPGDDFAVAFPRIEKTLAAPDYAPGDTIVGTLLSPPTNLTPLISNDAATSTIHAFILEGLCALDPNTQAPLPRLATSWQFSDDQLTMDFQLRHGVTFADGSPFTADDVIYTFQWLRNPDVEDKQLTSYYETFDSVEKTGEFSVRFKFNRPYFKSFQMVAGQGILSKAWYGKYDAKTFNRSTGLLMGTGPYMLEKPGEWKPEPGAPLTLVRNPRYWGPASAADKMVWKVIPSPTVRQTAFINGETDVFGPQPDQYEELLKKPQVVGRTKHFELDIPNIGYNYIGWNEKIDGKPTRFADPRVRKAMTLLIDRERICRDILLGHATVNSSCFSSLTAQADPEIKPWPYDPAQAEQLLAQAGYHKVNDVLIGPDGQPFRFTLTYNSANGTRAQIASFVKDALAKAGIIVDIDKSEWSVEIKRLTDHKLEAVLLAWTAQVEGDPYQIFSTSAIANSGSNTVSYSSPELDAAMQTARAIKDEGPRMLAWHKVHRILHEDQPYTFLFISRELTFIDGRFKDDEPTRTGIGATARPEAALEWYVPAESQKYKQ